MQISYNLDYKEVRSVGSIESNNKIVVTNGLWSSPSGCGFTILLID